ncbi:hypothetical protein [Rhizobium mulingense]|uniref:hypothetical protein n=1 Tax=Rhizobium mulingense TaxID=3031128 RepID=UPI002B486ED7|nr:hypothetical protein [Rhizobium sp. MJ21]MEB3045227.1 hypothetical protein [Rhizobium sp. MJ21]
MQPYRVLGNEILTSVRSIQPAKSDRRNLSAAQDPVKELTPASIPLEMKIYALSYANAALGECGIFCLSKLSLNFGQQKYFRQRNNARLMMTSS